MVGRREAIRTDRRNSKGHVSIHIGTKYKEKGEGGRTSQKHVGEVIDLPAAEQVTNQLMDLWSTQLVLVSFTH